MPLLNSLIIIKACVSSGHFKETECMVIDEQNLMRFISAPIPIDFPFPLPIACVIFIPSCISRSNKNRLPIVCSH